MADHSTHFARWLALKSRSRQSSTAEAATPADTPSQPDRETVEASLPDVETLSRESDYSQFMMEGVSSALRKKALRKLWRLEPSFSELDGLVEYGDDYTFPAFPRVVRTAWRAGVGFADGWTEQDDERERPSIAESDGDAASVAATDDK